jgi:O-antigen ligase
MIIGLMFLLPFVSLYHHLPIPSFYGEWIAAVLGLSAMLPLIKKASWQPLQIPQIALIFPGLAAILAMQWMLGMLHSHQYALLVLSYLTWAFFLVILGSYLRRALGWEKIATTLAWFLVIGGLVNAGIIVLQYAMQSGLSVPFMPKLNGYGAVSQVNHFADYVALATASLIYLYAKGRFGLKVFAVGLALFLAMLAFSGSRSSWLYLTALTVLAIGLQVNAMKQRTGSTNMRSLLRVSLVLLPAFAVVQLFIHFIVPDGLVVLATERLIESVNASSTSQRWLLWNESWRMFLQSPWLGIGVGEMRWHSFLLLETPSKLGVVGMFEHAHNLFLHLLTEMGIGAPLIVLAGVVAWLRGFKWRELSLETWWLLGLLSVLGIHSMLEYPLWYTYFLGIAAVLLGAGEEKLTAVNLPKSGYTFGRTVLAGLMLIGVVNLATIAVANAKLETWLLRAMRGEIATQEQEQFFEALNWVHEKSLLAPYAELMYATALVIDTNRLDSKLWLNQSAMRFMPMRKLAYQHVLLLKLKGDQAAAVQQLNRTLIAFPGNFTKELEAMPFKYWQDYLDVLSEARPRPLKEKK